MKVIKSEFEMLLPQFEDGVYYGTYENLHYETAYHTSKLRENLINWYPFEKEASVLVISSGAGALIPYLCQNTFHVTVIEDDTVNCEIIKERCNSFSNISIQREDFLKCFMQDQFDYILAIDYISVLLNSTQDKNSLHKFLQKASSNLKETGKLLIAINNSLGLKYLNGAFCGSETQLLYDNLKQPDFFSKVELEKIFNNTNLTNYKFYYPFPDYAFPRSIYTDESSKHLKFGHHYNEYYLDRYQFFNEFEMYHKLQDNGIVDKFANSFFVELCKKNLEDNNIIFVKNQYFMDKKAKSVTILYSGDKKRAEKKALTKEAKEYLFSFYQDSVRLNSAPHCFNYIHYTYDKKNGILQMPYIEGTSVSDLLENKLQLFLGQNGDGDVYKEILQVFSKIYKQMEKEAVKKKGAEICSKKFQDYFGNTIIEDELYCLNPVTLDLHLDHLYPNANGYDVIDIDPIKFFDIPIDYLMWCLIESWHYTYIYNNQKLEQLLNVEGICTDLGICAENITIFKKWRKNVFNNQSAVSQIQPFYSRKFLPTFLQYKDIEEFGRLKNSDSRVMNAMKENEVMPEVFNLYKTTPIILYGASAVGKLFYKILSQRGYKIVAFIDKRYDEIPDINGCPVISIDEKLNLNNCTVIIAIKNVFDHENIAKELFKRGYEQLIYRPKKILEGEYDEELQRINQAYDEIERFKWIEDISVSLKADNIPKTKSFAKIKLKDSACVSIQDNRIIAHIPVTNIYTAQQKLMPDYPWAEKSILSLIPHTALYRYLWDGGEDKTEWYIDFCSYGARNNHVEITPRWAKNLIDNRLTVLAAMKKSLEQDFKFFYRNPPEGIWNEEKGYFNLNGGRHRAALFVYQNFYTMPLEMERETYNKYLNFPVIKKIENYMQEKGIDLLEVPISHPYFLDVPVKRPQYYQCIIKPIIEYLSEIEMGKKAIIDFNQSRFFISAEDYGELKRCLHKSGFGIKNLKEESQLEKLFDELFYISKTDSTKYEANYLFLDCSSSLKELLKYPDVWEKEFNTVFILSEKKDTEEIAQFVSKNQNEMKMLKTCYWDSRSITLLAFERKR